MVAAVVGVLLLAGCGHATDPFVGTWKSGPGGTAVVAHLTGDRYRLTQLYRVPAIDTVTMMIRHGDTLSGSLRQFNQTTWETWKLILAHLPDGRLALTRTFPGADSPDAIFVMSRVSNSTAAPTPSTEPTPFQGVETKVFTSAALGVSFRYPTSWRVTTDSVSADGGRVALSPPGQTTSGAHFVVTVVFRRSSKAAPPSPFADADRSQNARSSAALSASGRIPIQPKLVAIGGLHLTRIAYFTTGFGAARWRGFAASSGRGGGRATSLSIDAASPESLWGYESGLCYAILATMRFTGPQG